MIGNERRRIIWRGENKNRNMTRRRKQRMERKEKEDVVGSRKGFREGVELEEKCESVGKVVRRKR